MTLYHATYGILRESVQAYGLCRSRIRKKSWKDCSSDYIYLCQDACSAAAFCEASEDIPEDWLDDIIVVAVNAGRLDASLFALDENISSTDRLTSYQYRGDIPVSAILAVLNGG